MHLANPPASGAGSRSGLRQSLSGNTEDMSLTTVLLDLDGVVRHFDPAHVTAVEDRHGLSVGSLTETASEPTLLERVITGHIRRSEWVEEVGQLVGHPLAAAEWMAERGTVDARLLAEVDGLRSRGIVVAVLTNGTDTIAEEMAMLGLDARFDAIFNSADIGFAKPDRRAFEHVCSELGVDPARVFFTDDSESKLQGALEIGMTARVFEGANVFRRHLVEAGFGTG